MSRARDDWGYRDPGLPGYMNVQELTPAERQAAEKAEERRAQQMAKDYAKSVAARREADAAAEASFDAVVRESSEIKTPAQLQAERLGWLLMPNGSLLHKTEAQRRAAQREAEYDGSPTPEERAELERLLASDEPEEDIWHDE